MASLPEGGLLAFHWVACPWLPSSPIFSLPPCAHISLTPSCYHFPRLYPSKVPEESPQALSIFPPFCIPLYPQNFVFRHLLPCHPGESQVFQRVSQRAVKRVPPPPVAPPHTGSLLSSGEPARPLGWAPVSGSPFSCLMSSLLRHGSWYPTCSCCCS